MNEATNRTTAAPEGVPIPPAARVASALAQLEHAEAGLAALLALVEEAEPGLRRRAGFVGHALADALGELRETLAEGA